MRCDISRYVLVLVVISIWSFTIATQTFAQASPEQGPPQAGGKPPVVGEKPAAPSPSPANEKTLPSSSKLCSACIPPDPWFIYPVLAFVLIGSFASMALIRVGLSATSWSLADALSEEAQVTASTGPIGQKTLLLDVSGKPLMVTELRASSSRVIALAGTVVIVWLFLGFGIFTLYAYAKTGTVPDSIDKVDDFLLAGLTLFAPYAVNKVGKMAEALSPKTS